VAEAIKREVFRFQSGAHPYSKTGTDEDLQAALLALTQAGSKVTFAADQTNGSAM
jgi:hypothetical protein